MNTKIIIVIITTSGNMLIWPSLRCNFLPFSCLAHPFPPLALLLTTGYCTPPANSSLTMKECRFELSLLIER